MPRKIPPTPDENIASAIALAKAILASDAHETHKRQFLSYCVYKVTEAAGKHNISYWSQGVFDLVEKHGSLKTVLKLALKPIHEHVTTRKSIVAALLKEPTQAETILREAPIACLVTKDEHAQLSNKLVGFDRYKAARIPVWDVYNERWTHDPEGHS